MWLRDQLGRGFFPQVQTWTTLEGKDAARLGDVDLLFVGGGNTFFLLHHLQSHGFVEPVRQWVEAGGNYYGGSAGAILATDSIVIADYATATTSASSTSKGWACCPRPPCCLTTPPSSRA